MRRGVELRTVVLNALEHPQRVRHRITPEPVRPHRKLDLAERARQTLALRRQRRQRTLQLVANAEQHRPELAEQCVEQRLRSEERRLGKEGVSTGKSRWSAYH